MKLSKPVYLAAGLYVILTLFLLFLITPRQQLFQKPILFFQDPNISDRVHAAIIIDPNGDKAFLTRIFHNKISFSLNNIVISLARSTDPVFFFTLTKSQYYNDYFSPFLLPIFFPFFLIGAFVLIQKWDKVKKKYSFLLPLLLISLIIDALFFPYTNVAKLIPLFISVQLVTFFGIYELTRSFKQ